ncbi:filamentous haemagglutinin-like protein [Beggiatoa sp. PS]|nr:filamentous haemagglutinin-like protein [Beggiatoa sp. PS]
MRFSDETLFEARYSEKPLLTVASIESFGFLGNATESIKVNQSFLAVNPGQALSLVAGDLMIDEATLFAESGQINLVAVGDVQALIPFSASELAQNTFGLQGEIRLIMSQSKAAERWEEAQKNKDKDVLGNIDVSGEGGGKVFIRGGQFYAGSSGIFADTFGDIPGASIDIAVKGEVILEDGAQITAENQGKNPMGQITINAKEAVILSGINEQIADLIKANPFSEFEDLFQSASGIRTDNVGNGAGGNIYIAAPFLSISPGLIGTATEGNGKAGDILIEAFTIELNRNGVIEAETVGEGQGGTLTIRATEALSLSNDSYLLVTSHGSGNAGHIEIQTPDLKLSDYSAIGSSSEQAGAGNITLNVRDRLHVTDNSLISAEAFGDEARDKGGNITISNPPLVRIDQNSQLLTRGFVGDGGNITVFTNNLRVSNDSRIDPSSQFGLNGKIQINSLELNENFMAKPLDFLDGSSLLNNRCAGITQETISQFIITIRDVLPPGPGDLMTDFLFLDEL